MNTTLLTAGIVCIIAAIVGGGLKAFGVEIPVLQSTPRQIVLALVGVVCLVLAYPRGGPPMPDAGCDYRFESENVLAASAISGNRQLRYSGKDLETCPRRDPGVEYFLIADDATGATQQATTPAEKALRNFAPEGDPVKQDGRILYTLNYAFDQNNTGKTRLVVVSWGDPKRQKVELRQQK